MYNKLNDKAFIIRPNVLSYTLRTFVVMVPAARVVRLDDVRRRVGGQQLIDVVALAPRQRATQHLARFLHVEVTCAEEA